MATFRLTRKARDDLKSIARYTQKAWGVAQRNKYLAQLDRRFALLADSPNVGRSCDAIRLGYRKDHVSDTASIMKVGTSSSTC